MYKVECPRCQGGSGTISAYRHILGGVCFKCKGTGYIERKTKPERLFWFVAMQKWEDETDENYNGGKFIRTFKIKAKNQADADKKLKKRLSGCGREFFAKIDKDNEQDGD